MSVVQRKTAVRTQMDEYIAEATKLAAKLEYQSEQREHRMRCYLCSRVKGFGDIITEDAELDKFADLLILNKQLGESGWALAQAISNYPIRSYR